MPTATSLLAQEAPIHHSLSVLSLGSMSTRQNPHDTGHAGEANCEHDFSSFPAAASSLSDEFELGSRGGASILVPCVKLSARRRRSSTQTPQRGAVSRAASEGLFVRSRGARRVALQSERVSVEDMIAGIVRSRAHQSSCPSNRICSLSFRERHARQTGERSTVRAGEAQHLSVAAPGKRPALPPAEEVAGSHEPIDALGAGFVRTRLWLFGIGDVVGWSVDVVGRLDVVWQSGEVRCIGDGIDVGSRHVRAGVLRRKR